MKRFVLARVIDVSGISGEGTVAEGVKFSDGTVVLHWLTSTASTGIYRSIEDVRLIHGHNGKTIVCWIPEDDDNCLICQRPLTPTREDPLCQTGLCGQCNADRELGRRVRLTR